MPARPRSPAVVPLATSCTFRFPEPPLLSVSLNVSPIGAAVTLIAVFLLIAVEHVVDVAGKAQVDHRAGAAAIRDANLAALHAVAAVQLVERNALIDEPAEAERERARADGLARPRSSGSAIAATRPFAPA